MKHLTLDEAWTLCIEMWRWIAKRIRQDPTLHVGDLKRKWLETHTKDELAANCYFCEYDGLYENDCQACPGKKIDGTFNCGNAKYNWYSHPLAFYAELRRLYKIYKSRKKKLIKKRRTK